MACPVMVWYLTELPPFLIIHIAPVNQTITSFLCLITMERALIYNSPGCIKFMNLNNDSLEVVVGKRANITLSALETVESAWAGIVKVILQPAEERARIALVKRLLVILQARVERLSNL